MRGTVVHLSLLRSTFMLRVSAMRGDEEVYRYLGIDESSPLGDVSHAIGVAFSLTGHHAAPAGFATDPGEPRPETRIDPDSTLGDALPGARTTIYYHWGLWRFDLELVEAYPRDDSTPPAVCVAGAGDFGTPLEITAINRALLGDATADAVLAEARTEVRNIVARSSMHDFVLLLKALDLNREAGADAEVRASIRDLPLERTRAGRDAFWVAALALACLADEETTDTIIATTYSALGYTGVPAVKVRELCSASLGRLDVDRIPPVERLDVFRALLRG
ncbi:plasmid pRiA4b ORF-3 family protein [Corynebacterium qintianiae]|uniref:plasmid pRiA4b ORF-3 family protein n=1 Tax=Corynebacterium qintianiae TaxID=2709392 RepID=UPI0013EAF4B6|nr:plasmid pRiA4b ORF-3 family protein [Corynebacterium qintianiae]